ncbi:peptidoglycan binding protein CsiV [Vibrio sonorensis]|uniref:peptidoglycan binding protein CsiV n=1 Tax=Vibrio sonorensis TaxID=1004316 RepID=UPI0008D9C64C|nr:peptidoglycan binding protein CsiV [Vibrio sonorensis]
MKKLIPLLLLVIAWPTWAQRQFDVEVIIFKRAVDAEQTSESWPNSVEAINLDKTGYMSDSNYRKKKGVSLLSASSYELKEEAEKLRRHAGFEVLMHTAWRQGDQGRFSAPSFRIRAGRDFSKQFHPDGTQISGDTVVPLDGQLTEQNVPSPIYELDGKLQIYVEHYLYADVVLDLKAPSVRKITLEDKPLEFETRTDLGSDDNSQNIQVGMMEDVTPEVTVESFLKHYRMDQKRRMRSSETHFLDHPLLGMIIQVRRVNN